VRSAVKRKGTSPIGAAPADRAGSFIKEGGGRTILSPRGGGGSGVFLGAYEKEGRVLIKLASRLRKRRKTIPWALPNCCEEKGKTTNLPRLARRRRSPRAGRSLNRREGEGKKTLQEKGEKDCFKGKEGASSSN